MSPPVSLAEFSQLAAGTLKQGQVDRPDHLKGKDLTLSVRPCYDNVSNTVYSKAEIDDMKISEVRSEISIIKSQQGDTADMKTLEETEGLFKAGFECFLKGFGGNSVSIQGKDVDEEYVTEEQKKARTQLSYLSTKVNDARALIKQYRPRNNYDTPEGSECESS